MVEPEGTETCLPLIFTVTSLILCPSSFLDNGFLRAAVNTGTALDALVDVDDMLLLLFAGDGADGAVAGALGAALAGVGDLQRVELRAGAGGALLVADVGDILVLEVAHGAENRVRGRLAEGAYRRPCESMSFSSIGRLRR